MTSEKSSAAKSKSIEEKTAFSPEQIVPTVVVQESGIQPEEKAVAEIIRIKPRRLWIVVILLGLTFDYLFWEQILGINYTIFLFLCLTAGLFVLISNDLRPALKSLFLIVPFTFFTIVAFLRQEPLTIFLAYALSLFSIGLFTVTYFGGRWPFYRLSGYFRKFFLLLGDMIARPLGLIRQTRKERLERGVGVKGRFVWGLLRGLIIALPLVLCFGSLLASADLVFNQKMDDLFEEFTAEKITENIQRFVLIVSCAYLLAGTFLHSALRSGDNELTGEDKPLINPFLGFTETSVILASISILFSVFVFVQFQYFFGGETNIGVAGYTYSQYARRGFNELVTVAFFSLVLILGLNSLTHWENELQRKIHTGLNILLIALVLVILVSAYQRIALGIEWHGFSRLRLYPRIFLIWLGMLFVAVAVLEVARQERFFAFAVVLAAIGFAVSVTLFNIDAATVKHNVFRAWHGKNLNVPHLASLSTDAIPALAEEFLSPALPESTREGVGAILACYRYFEDYPHVSPYDWRSFNLSRWRAHEALQSIRPHLAGYVIRYNKWPVRVRTPGNILYDCQDYTSREDD